VSRIADSLMVKSRIFHVKLRMFQERLEAC